MNTEISYRKSWLYMAIFGHGFALFSLVVLFYPLFYPEKQQNHISGILIVFVILLVFACNLWMFATSFSVPAGVYINPDIKFIEVKYLLKKAKVIQLDEMACYRSTVIYNRVEKNPGIIIHLKDGERLLFSKWNLTEYKPLQDFLNESEIGNAGPENFGTFSYYTQFLTKK